jgi:hypothetical protein
MGEDFFVRSDELAAQMGALSGGIVGFLLVLLPTMLQALHTYWSSHRIASLHFRATGKIVIGALFGGFFGWVAGFIAGAAFGIFYGPLVGGMSGAAMGLITGMIAGAIAWERHI